MRYDATFGPNDWSGPGTDEVIGSDEIEVLSGPLSPPVTP